MPEGTNSNNVPDENNTDVFQAIAGFGWGKKFGTILDTVKKQSEVFVDVTKRDLTEFVTVVRDDTTTTVDTLSHRINDLAVTAQHTLLAHPSASSSTTTATSSSSLSTVSDPTPSDPSTGESSSSTVKDGTPASAEQAQGPVPEPSISASASASAALSSFIKSATSQLPTITLPTAIANIDLAAIRERLDQPVTFEIPATIGGVDLVALRERLEQPVHFSDIRLPGGVDLAHLREEISQGTRFAEQYLGRFGEEITAVLTNAVTVTPPEEQGRLAGTNRKDALLAKLRGDSATYLTEPVAAPAEGEGEDHDAAAVFATFAAAFSVAEYTEDIARLLNEYPEMRKIMERIGEYWWGGLY
ncbi:hypothetical protein BC938DRAFT_474205 [Jimgerdemannia flammicorona]|uniref:Uncharacterized protein n=1 Tax=Jimgerdemannia flammicorona TaxID=994334 RepID=A0A433Q2L0_9FUNG|nr:hypothetical protein BC938DRAFT_474205 [Jimgerdemannia flammicorona]